MDLTEAVARHDEQIKTLTEQQNTIKGLTEGMSIGGQIFAGLAVAAGSSCINEILQKVQGA